MSVNYWDYKDLFFFMIISNCNSQFWFTVYDFGLTGCAAMVISYFSGKAILDSSPFYVPPYRFRWTRSHKLWFLTDLVFHNNFTLEFSILVHCAWSWARGLCCYGHFILFWKSNPWKQPLLCSSISLISSVIEIIPWNNPSMRQSQPLHVGPLEQFWKWR